MSREYCRKTPISKMGFSQKASCKAQGLIKRTSRKLKGKLVKSSKYKRDGSLFSDTRKSKKSYFTGYGTEEKAKKTLKSIKKLPHGKQNQIVNTMYNRAKFHANQTKDMRKAIKVFRKWIKEK
jgi:hypothetical protein